MEIKRKLADLAEAATGARITRPAEVGIAFEETHLKQFFAFFHVDCIFDVGANAGQYVEMLRKRVGFQGEIISFEPIPEMAEQLRQKAVGDRHWHIEPVALGRTTGEAVFNVTAATDFSSFLSPVRDETDKWSEQNKVVRSIPVKTSTLEIEYRKYKEKLGFSRPFLKMDTQGSDVTVVESAKETIKEFIGLQSELAVKRLYEGAPSFQEALALYQSKGFELSALVPNHPWNFPYLLEVDCVMFRSGAEKMVG